MSNMLIVSVTHCIWYQNKECHEALAQNFIVIKEESLITFTKVISFFNQESYVSMSLRN